MRAVVVSVVLALILAAPAAAAEDDPWATVNVCDSADRPNVLGVRGSMPGLARRSALAMRFRVQYRTDGGGWRLLENNKADSGWRALGHRRGGRVELGWSFQFAPPRRGDVHVLRGVVHFRWRRGSRTVRRERRLTEAGHRSTLGADPPGYSAAECGIS
jgi:hypothetical protein